MFVLHKYFCTTSNFVYFKPKYFYHPETFQCVLQVLKYLVRAAFGSQGKTD